MKKLLLLFIYFSFSYLTAQNDNVVESGSGCGCDVILTAIPPIVDPGGPPIIGPPPIIVEGDLERFVNYNDGQCIRTVEVKERYYNADQILYRKNYMVNDVHALIEKYGSFSTYCFDGYFYFSETISISGGKLIKILDDSYLDYRGSGAVPAISFDGNGGRIEGGEIRTRTPMNNGLISISTEGSIVNNAMSNTIKNTKLVNQFINPPRENDELPSASAINNRGIVFSNSFETLTTQRDNGTNYFTHVIDVDISGFSVGMHMRGWSNASHIRKIRLHNISDYGIWISGCVDNSISDITFRSCKQAFGFRFDNYIDDKVNNYTPSDPNLRFEIDIEEELESIISISLLQTEFNQNLNNLFFTEAEKYFTIFEACKSNDPGISSDPRSNEPFLNEVEEVDGENNDILLRFGLKGYMDDEAGDYEYLPDLKNITTVENERISSTYDIGIYKSSFIHDVEQTQVDLANGATCKTDLLYTTFYRAPAFNSISQVNLFANPDEDNIKQVLNLVQLEGREDDGEMCLKNPPNNLGFPEGRCSNCTYFFKDREVNALGFENNIYLCNTPASFNIDDEIINTAECKDMTSRLKALKVKIY